MLVVLSREHRDPLHGCRSLVMKVMMQGQEVSMFR